MFEKFLSDRGANSSSDHPKKRYRSVNDFGNINRETNALVNSVAIFPCSHWGRLVITGNDHLNLLQRMTTNNMGTLKSGSGIESVFSDPKGRVIDLGLFYHRKVATLCIVSPESTRVISEWLDKYTFSEEMTLSNVETETEMIEVLGPDARKLISSVFQVDINELLPHQLLESPQIPPQSWLAIRPFGQHNGVRIIVKTIHASQVWQQLEKAGGVPVGETSWNNMRIELGIPKKPNELNKDNNPWEAGLASAISLDKGCYIGQEVIARLEAYKKIKKNLWGILFLGKTKPKPGTKLRVKGKIAGTITSSCSSIRTGVIALAFVSKEYCHQGISVETEHGDLNGETVSLPFAPETILAHGRKFSKI